MSLKLSKEEWELAEGIQGLPTRAELHAEITKLKSQLETLRGAMKADDERLRAAGLRSDCYAGCDTPEAMVDKIELLKSQLEEARVENKRLRDGVEIMANPEHWGAALNLSTSIGIKAWDFARALLNGSASNKEGGKS